MLQQYVNSKTITTHSQKGGKVKEKETPARELPIGAEDCCHKALKDEVVYNLPNQIATCDDLKKIERSVQIARKLKIDQSKITDLIRKGVWENEERFTPSDVPSDEKALRELLWRVSLGAGPQRIQKLLEALEQRGFTARTLKGICEHGIWKYKFFYGIKQPLKPPFEVEMEKGKILFRKVRPGR